MFTTPLRSEMIPPSAAKISGVANVSPDAITADQVNTSFTFAAVWLVIASESGIAISPAPTVAPPRRRCFGSRRTRAPMIAAIRPSAIDGTGVRSVIGGSVRIHAIPASTAAPMPTCLAKLGGRVSTLGAGGGVEVAVIAPPAPI